MVAVDDGTITKVERERLTVAAILDLVRGNYALKGYRSAASVGAHLKKWVTALGAKTKALEVTTGQVQRVLERWRARGDSAATCNRRLSNLRRAYRLAKLRLDPGTLDFSELFLPEDGPRGHYMAPDVFAKICAELPAYVRAFFMFAYLTGVRKQQLARTTVAHVNTSTMTIT